MKEILALIEEKHRVYSQLPFFHFLRDRSISPEQRLAFAPCAAPFIMGFADLNKYALRQEPTTDRVQEILNQHTYEDDFHWQWYLEDMQKLGFNNSLDFDKSLKFLWSDTTKQSRLLTYQLYEYLACSKPIEKLIILEAIESTADIFLSLTKQITDEISINTQQEYRYFGSCHLEQETNHDANSVEMTEYINNICLSKDDKQHGIELVERVFDIFTQWTHELLAFAQDSQIPSVPSCRIKRQSNDRAALAVGYY